MPAAHSKAEVARHFEAKSAGLRTILFVCTGNAVRSQMAEALVNHHFGKTWAAFSAGVMPMEVPKNVRKVLEEIGIDTARQTSKHVDTFKDCRFDKVVVLCSDASRFCPVLPECTELDHLIFHDPLSSSMFADGFCLSLKSTMRGLRDEMKKTVLAYLEDKEKS